MNDIIKQLLGVERAMRDELEQANAALAAEWNVFNAHYATYRAKVLRLAEQLRQQTEALCAEHDRKAAA